MKKKIVSALSLAAYASCGLAMDCETPRTPEEALAVLSSEKQLRTLDPEELLQTPLIMQSFGHIESYLNKIDCTPPNTGERPSRKRHERLTHVFTRLSALNHNRDLSRNRQLHKKLQEKRHEIFFNIVVPYNGNNLDAANKATGCLAEDLIDVQTQEDLSQSLIYLKSQWESSEAYQKNAENIQQLLLTLEEQKKQEAEYRRLADEEAQMRRQAELALRQAERVEKLHETIKAEKIMRYDRITSRIKNQIEEADKIIGETEHELAGMQRTGAPEEKQEKIHQELAKIKSSRDALAARLQRLQDGFINQLGRHEKDEANDQSATEPEKTTSNQAASVQAQPQSSLLWRIVTFGYY